MTQTQQFIEALRNALDVLAEKEKKHMKKNWKEGLKVQLNPSTSASACNKNARILQELLNKPASFWSKYPEIYRYRVMKREHMERFKAKQFRKKMA